MHKFWVLLKLNFQQMLCSFSGMGRGKNKQKAASGVGALCIIGGLSVYLSGLYSVILADGLREIGQLSVLFLLMSAMAVGLCTMFTLFAAQGVVFGGRDNDFMLSMPVSSFTLLLCRVLALYLENLLCTALILLPAGVVYLLYGGGGGVLLLLRAGLAAVLLAFLPSVFSLILGFFLSWLSSKFRKKALLTNLLYFGSFGVLMVLIFRVSFSASGGSQALAGIEGMFGPWALPLRLTRDGICGSPLALLALLLLCVLPFLLVVWVFSTRYRRILSGLKSQSARSDYKLGRLSAVGSGKALLRKEASRFFGTPIYFFNAGFGLISLPILAVAAVLFRGKIGAFLAMLAQEVGALPVELILLAAVGFFVSTVSITASSISMEGRQLWILKEAPVSTAEIFAAKVQFQMLLSLPTVAFSLLLVWFAFSLPPLEGALLLLSALVYSAAVAYLGLLLNLRFPKLDAMNDTMVVKNSVSAVVSLVANVLLLAVGCILGYFVRQALGGAAGLALCAGFFAAAVAACALRLRNKGAARFAALE